MKSLLIFCALFLATVGSATGENPFEVPDGFTISKFGGDDLAHDIWCMTLDPENDQVCVGGPGYIKFLVDDDNDGTADRSVLFTDKVRRGPMGLLIDGTSIISVESNAVVCYRDENRDLMADGAPEVWVEFTGKGGEHGPHGIRKGPDGWYYVVCGNNAGVNDSHGAIGDSPIKNPNQGCIIRIAPFGAGTEIVAHGFRNPYDIAFSDQGRLFTWDSDNERDHHLPWYAHTRVFDVAFGRHHGWLNPGHKQSYNTPEYYSIDRLAQVRRGSPTGIAYYWHDGFPEKYRKGLFYACWTFGRIYYSPLVWRDEVKLRQEKSFLPQSPEVFAKAGPDGGFAPVDLEIDSKGRLWVACGGRNTSGSVYYITPPGGPGKKKKRVLNPLPKSEVGRILLKRRLQHPHAVRTFLKDPKELHLVYHAFQESHGGINHLPMPRAIDAGYTFNPIPSEESKTLRETITSETGAELLRDMDLIAEHALTDDAVAFADFWLEHDGSNEIEPWRHRNYRELARTLGCVKTEFAPVIEHITSALREDTHPTDDVHYLCCLAQMPGPRTSIATWRIASAFLRVDAKLEKIPGAHPSRNWPLRLRDLFAVHCELSPRLRNDVMWSHSAFGNSIHHARYIDSISDPELKEEVTKKMYQRLKTSNENWTPQWTSLFLKQFTDAPIDEFRHVWDTRSEVRHLLAPALLKKFDTSVDRRRIFECLTLRDFKIAETAAQKLAGENKPLEIHEAEKAALAAVRHHRKLKPGNAITGLLNAQNVEEALTNAESQFPKSEVINRLAGSQDMDAFEKRLGGVRWDQGRVTEGKEAFARLGCAVCHSGQNRLGPGMKGVAARFGRDDFFKHTFNPNLAISDLYKAIEVTTNTGKTFRGVPVYTSPDQTILEVGPGQTINFSQGEIRASGPIDFSPMPEGLLLGASDQDLADLWAYIAKQ